jgi:hypothetical protein
MEIVAHSMEIDGGTQTRHLAKFTPPEARPNDLFPKLFNVASSSLSFPDVAIFSSPMKRQPGKFVETKLELCGLVRAESPSDLCAWFGRNGGGWWKIEGGEKIAIGSNPNDLPGYSSIYTCNLLAHY